MKTKVFAVSFAVLEYITFLLGAAQLFILAVGIGLYVFKGSPAPTFTEPGTTITYEQHSLVWKVVIYGAPYVLGCVLVALGFYFRSLSKRFAS